MQRQSIYPWGENVIDDLIELNVLDGEVVDEFALDQYPSESPLLSLGEVLNAFGSFPPYSVMVGVCQDGLPLLLNLKDSTAGSLLIEGEPRRGKTQILKTVLASAAALNQVERVNFCAISPNPDEMAALLKFPHCQGLAAPYERQASEIILELSAIAEQRRFGRERGPAFILAIDDLGALVGEHLDYEVLIHLKWLISKGPGSEIWTIATLPGHSIATFDLQFASLFRTRIISGRSFHNKKYPDRPDTNSALSIRNNDFTFVTLIKQQPIHFLPLSIG